MSAAPVATPCEHCAWGSGEDLSAADRETHLAAAHAPVAPLVDHVKLEAILLALGARGALADEAAWDAFADGEAGPDPISARMVASARD